MSTHKHFDKICCIVLVLTLIVTVLFVNGEAIGIQPASRVMGYETKLFDNSRVHTVNIQMDDWEGFLDTCTSEEYSNCNITIDGELYKNVAIRGKGNTSLSSVASYGNDRYSFKVEFDHYDSTSSYHGLDKLCLNNLIQDNTMMKDYLTYTMMGEFGVSAPLCSYAYITVNGEDWGLYLAVEAVEDSFLQRNYGSNYGELYKPDSLSFGGGRGNGRDFNMDDFAADFEDKRAEFEEQRQGAAEGSAEPSAAQGGAAMPDGFDSSSMRGGAEQPTEHGGRGGMTGGFDISSMAAMLPDDFDISAITENISQDSELYEIVSSLPEGATVDDLVAALPEDFDISDIMGSFSEGFDPTEMFGKGGGGMGGFGMGSDDVKLQYIDDDPDSYSNIFDSAKTDVSDADKQRLIASLKTLSEGGDVSSAVNMEEVIRYFVVHNFVCNGDSYTGSMIHNYYLYEEDGQLSMLPWDYNLAFGSFNGGMGGSSGATETVNDPIDTPVSGGTGEDRPMIGWIFSSEEYTALYHQYFEEFIAEYYDGGRLAEIIDAAAELIAPYVETDPTKFCTYEEFEKGVVALREFCLLRCESVSGQLDGTIPSTSDGQTDSTALIDASSVSISDMGSMGMGGGGDHQRPDGDSSQRGQHGSQRESAELPAGEQSVDMSSDTANTLTSAEGEQLAAPSAPSGGMAEGMTPPDMAGGDFSEGMTPPSMPDMGGEMPDFGGELPSGDFTPPTAGGEDTQQTTAEQNGTEQIPPEQPSTEQSGAADGVTAPESASAPEQGMSQMGSSHENGGSRFEQGGEVAPQNGVSAGAGSEIIMLAVSAVLLLAGLIFAKLYK